MNEKEFLGQVLDTAQWCGWKMIYHTHDSRRSAPGFPDLVLVKPGRLIFAELKTDAGRLTAEQTRWLAMLQTVEVETEGIVSAHVWRPAMIDEIVAVLQSADTLRLDLQVVE